MSVNVSVDVCPSESSIFVQILSRHRVLFESLKTPETNRKKNEAVLRIAEEFSQKCGKKLTIRQVFKKVHSIKQRLREKNYKNLSRRKQVPFSKWEQKFLALWIGNGILVPKNIPSRDVLPIEESPKYKTPEDIIRNFEVDYNLLEDDTNTSSENSSHNCEPEPEPETLLKRKTNDMRAALISQIKMLKAQEAVAKTEENNHLYKLSLLQQNNVIKSEN